MSFAENAARRPLGCQAVYAGSDSLIRPRSDSAVRTSTRVSTLMTLPCRTTIIPLR